MSIPVLTQVYDEVRRLSIAGSLVASGDFRLKKLVAPLEQSGQKAPVFAKVAQAVTKLVESTEKTSAEALLDLSTLINAILYTQGETGIAGTLTPIVTTDLGQQQIRTSARVLKPLLQALSETGSGRTETVKEAIERGTFKDLRLVGPALGALDDPHGEVAELIMQHVLPLYGQAILPELRERLNLQGKTGHERRLRLMHQLDPDGTREIVKRALDEGSKGMRVVAIECLGSSPEDLSFLLEQSKAKAKDVRLAAMKALAKSSSDEAAQVLCKAIQGAELEVASAPICDSQHPLVVKTLIEQTKAEWSELLGSDSKDREAISKRATRLLLLLNCFRQRNDKLSIACLQELFADRNKLASIKGDPGGQDVHRRLVLLFSVGPAVLQKAVIGVHTTLTEEELADVFWAARKLLSPAELFETFSPYLTAPFDAKKKGNPAFLRRKAIIEGICHPYRWRWFHRQFLIDTKDDAPILYDLRWLDLALDQRIEELANALATSGHKRCLLLLSQWFEEKLVTSTNLNELQELVRAMTRIKHPKATDAVIATIKKFNASNSYYSLYAIGQSIAELPKTSLPQLEAMMSTLSDKMIDQLLDYMTQLKTRPE